jgi:hypothetical protein
MARPKTPEHDHLEPAADPNEGLLASSEAGRPVEDLLADDPTGIDEATEQPDEVAEDAITPVIYLTPAEARVVRWALEALVIPQGYAEVLDDATEDVTTVDLRDIVGDITEQLEA